MRTTGRSRPVRSARLRSIENAASSGCASRFLIVPNSGRAVRMRPATRPCSRVARCRSNRSSRDRPSAPAPTRAAGRRSAASTVRRSLYMSRVSGTTARRAVHDSERQLRPIGDGRTHAHALFDSRFATRRGSRLKVSEAAAQHGVGLDAELADAFAFLGDLADRRSPVPRSTDRRSSCAFHTDGTRRPGACC